MARCVVVGPGPRSGLPKGRLLSASAGHRPGEGTGQEIGVEYGQGVEGGEGSALGVLLGGWSGEKLFACVPWSDIVVHRAWVQGKMEGSTMLVYGYQVPT